MVRATDTGALFSRPRPAWDRRDSARPRPGSSARAYFLRSPVVPATDGAQGDHYRDRVEPGEARLHVWALYGRDGGRTLQDAGLREGGRARDGRARRGSRHRLRRCVAYWSKHIAALAPDGRMVMLRFLSGRELEQVDLGPLLFKRVGIQGTTLRARSVPCQADLVERFKRDVVGEPTGPKGMAGWGRTCTRCCRGRRSAQRMRRCKELEDHRSWWRQ
jgi:hypothetical protein